MASETLRGSSVISSANWTNPNNALGAPDGTNATTDTIGASINLECTDLVETSEILTTSILYGVTSMATNTGGRSQAQLVELLDSANTVLGSFTTPTLSTSTLQTHSSTTTVSLNRATVNGLRVRVTTQESGGMSGTVQHRVDGAFATVTFDVVVVATGTLSVTLDNASISSTGTVATVTETNIPINGTFDDSTGWILGDSCSVSGGQLQVSATTNQTNTYNLSGLEAGIYRIDWTLISPGSGNYSVQMSSVNEGTLLGPTTQAAGSYSSQFTVTSAPTNIRIRVTLTGGSALGSIDNVTLTKLGTPEGIVGNLVLTLDSATISSTGTVGTSGSSTGTLSITLDDATVSSTGEIVVSGQVIDTLDDATVSSTGEIVVSGQVIDTLDDAVVSSTGTVGISGLSSTGSLSVTLDDAIVSSIGSMAVKAIVSITTDNAVGTSQATVQVQGALGQTLDDAVLSAASIALVKGQVSKVLDDASVSSTGKIHVEGQVSVSLDDAVLSAYSSAPGSTTGSLNKILDDAVLVAQAAIVAKGTLSQILDSASISSEGNVSIRGDISVNLDDSTISTQSVVLVQGTSATDLQDAIAAAVAAVRVLGQASIQLDDATVSSTTSNQATITGQLSVTLDSATLSSTGILETHQQTTALLVFFV